MESNHEDRWVDERLASLEPDWCPDFGHGRTLLDAGLTKPQHSWHRATAIGVAALAATCAILLVVPQTRAFAQQLWYHLMLNRVDVLRLDFSDLALRAQVTAGRPQEAKGVDDAEQQAGFRPYLPEPGVLPSNPSLSTIGLTVAELTIHVSDLETALAKVGAGDVHVPQEWEGVRLRASIGPMVNLGYPGEIGILQAKPIELAYPAGFPLQKFAEVAFRSIGVSAAEATKFAGKFAANPAWLLGIPADEVVNVQEVSLHRGPALLLEDFGDDGKVERVTVFRSTKDRVYCVLANSRQQGLAIAEALP